MIWTGLPVPSTLQGWATTARGHPCTLQAWLSPGATAAFPSKAASAPPPRRHTAVEGNPPCLGELVWACDLQHSTGFVYTLTVWVSWWPLGTAAFRQLE